MTYIYIYIYIGLLYHIYGASWHWVVFFGLTQLNLKFSMIYKSLLGFMKSNTFTKNFNIFKVM